MVIVNDTNLLISCVVLKNKDEEQILIKPFQSIIVTDIDSAYTIKKTDLWSLPDLATKTVSVIEAVDLNFSNMLEPKFLPYSIQFVGDVTCTNNVYVSQIIEVKETNLLRWKKTISIQYILVALTFVFIGIVLGFAFSVILNPWYLSAYLLIIALLLIALKRKFINAFVFLKSLTHNKK